MFTLLKRCSGIILIIILVFSAACKKKALDIKKIEDHQSIEAQFKNPQDVTRKCLECHEEAGDDILKTRHWKWTGSEYVIRGQKKIKFGKLNQINNFCIALTSNWPRCTSCHIGYGWKNKKFDFNNKENIDCLVCHDTTGTYEKHPTMAGYPVTEKTETAGKTFVPPDYLEIARSAGKPTRNNCGSCHFFGGGGDAVKHGNLDSGLSSPKNEMDTHMGKLNFSCIKCHKTKNHNISGTLHGPDASGYNHFGCTKCHKGPVHKSKKQDKHSAHIACQTCHITVFGNSRPTKTWWDWSSAGIDKPVVKDKYGMPLYDKKKGDFKWEKSVIPEYHWFNGKQKGYITGDKVKDPSKELVLNPLEGNIKDKNSRIMPFKVMKGRQAYDKKYGFLIVPKLFGKGGFWKTFNWNRAFAAGMKEEGLPYSGTYGWIRTKMLWPLNHMVPAKENALKCSCCHGKNQKRFDWIALGYRGDPKKVGGRFSK